ncbi:MAG: hypothetical protein KBH26_01725, partial [Thiopseudomonas sp.]|nr:hypothetical protein [Thiopseudomonas sp.]
MRLGHVELDKCYPRFFTPVDVRAMEIIVNGQGCQMNFIRLFERAWRQEDLQLFHSSFRYVMSVLKRLLAVRHKAYVAISWR